MKYDEFASDELRNKYPLTHSFRYGWYTAGISDGEAKAAGWEHDFVLWVREGDIIAVIMYLLVYMNGCNPEVITDEYVRKNYTEFYGAYIGHIIAAFEDEAVKRMRKLIPAKSENEK